MLLGSFGTAMLVLALSGLPPVALFAIGVGATIAAVRL